jgi:hypothetical protein
MVAWLVEALYRAGIDADYRDIEEILWLGRYLASSSQANVPSPAASAVSALQRSLEVGRAFRPFARRHRSNKSQRFDEAATAYHSSEIGILLPQFSFGAEPWFELALVVEQGMSFVLWSQTIKELHLLLARHGAFRDVRRWTLLMAERGVRLLGPSGIARSPRELIDPGVRRLIIVVSECISQGWTGGAIPVVLAEWCSCTSCRSSSGVTRK